MVSVCMATYDGERFLRRQLATILEQLAEGDELVISDDSSSDGTLDIIRAWNDPRIVLLPDQKFHSPCFNLENALKHSTGEIVVIADQDDEWVEGRLSVALEALQARSLIACDAEIIDAEGRSTQRSLTQMYPARTGFVVNLLRNRYVGCCLAFRREVLEIALPFPPNIPWHDWWLGLLAEIYFSTGFLKQRLVRYRRHGKNASRISEKSGHSWKRKFEVRWRMSNALVRRCLDLKRRA